MGSFKDLLSFVDAEVVVWEIYWKRKAATHLTCAWREREQIVGVQFERRSCLDTAFKPFSPLLQYALRVVQAPQSGGCVL